MATNQTTSSTADTLHRLERAVLPQLDKQRELSELTRLCKLTEVEVMRALQWLSNKELVTTTQLSAEIITLDTNGKVYRDQGLPERRALKALTEAKELGIDELVPAGLDAQEINIVIGTLKKKAAIEVEKKEGKLHIRMTEAGRKLLTKTTPEEQFLKEKFPLAVLELTAEQRYAYDELKKRKHIIKTELVKTLQAQATAQGQALIQQGISQEEQTDKLTRNMLVTGKWKTQKFRAYDVSINVPKITRGKTHFVNQAIRYAKRIWLDMGFVEMTGKHVQTAFWDLDALFVPQDHPARDMQDTFYLEHPQKGTVSDQKMFKAVKEVHEHGADTGSKGWQSSYDKGVALLNLLRTHTTVLSAHKLSTIQQDGVPAKFFTIGKVYRNEALDWKHLFEFHQVDGIVIDPNANLRHLKGYLEEFYKKMGYTKVRMRPAHFPYTEPSIEPEVWHPVKKEWIEMGGAGIFRPEVTKTLLGVEIPVLAWGLGLERIISPYYGITDIRELYNNDMKQLRSIKNYIR